MLNFRQTNIIFGAAMVLLLIADFFLPIYRSGYFILLALYLLILFVGSYRVDSGFYTPVLFKANTSRKVIAFSFDDGPNPDQTPRILEILRSKNIQAGFFCIGKNIEKNPALLKRIHEDGHIIGNHSYSHHALFDFFTSRRMYEELELTSKLIQNTTGQRPLLFRPPYGVTTPTLAKAISKGKYITVGWNVRSLDTVIDDDARLLKKMIKKIKPGNIFLFHDTSEATVKMLPAFIKAVHKKGFEIERPDKLLEIHAYA